MQILRPFSRGDRRQGFTLVELLVVVAIAAILIAVSIPSFENHSSGFSRSLSEIMEIMEQARSYAVAENTYVWVAFYPLDPSQLAGAAKDSSGDQLFIAVFASDGGNNPFSWTDASSHSIPYTDPATGTAVFLLDRIQLFRQIRLWPQGGSGGGYYNIGSIPASAPAPAPASPTPVFSVRAPLANSLLLSAQPVPANHSAIAVIAFNPRGSALASGSLAASIGLDFQPMKSAAVADSANLATLRIDGLTGIATLYRQ